MEAHYWGKRTSEWLAALHIQNAENLKQIFPEKEYRGFSPNFHIQVSVSKLYIPTMGLPFLLEEICGPILGYVEFGAEATLFPEKEYINGMPLQFHRFLTIPALKGTVSRDFLLPVFFMNQFLPSPRVSH